MNYYASQVITPIVGTKDSSLSPTGVTLESTYQTEDTGKPTKSFATGGFEKITIDAIYTMGATETSNSIEVKMESSEDGTNWYRISNESTTAGTTTLTAKEITFVGANAAAATFSVILNIAYKFMRVSFKETGVATNKGTVYAEITLSGK